MKIKFFKPHPDLSSFIKFYWLLDINEQSDQPQRLLPGIYPDLIIHLGPHSKYKIGNSSWKKRNPVGFIEGLFRSFLLLKFTGSNRLIGIRFNSSGLYSFVKTPLEEFIDNFIDLTDVFSHSGKVLIDQLANANNLETLPRILDRFLLHKLQFDNIEFDNKKISHILQTMMAHRGILQIRQLCDMTSCSERQLERIFKRFIGISPEGYAQRLRLHNFINIVLNSKDNSFTQAAHECCYTDQSHLIRTFKQYTGLTPGTYFYMQHQVQQALNSEQYF